MHCTHNITVPNHHDVITTCSLQQDKKRRKIKFPLLSSLFHLTISSFCFSPLDHCTKSDCAERKVRTESFYLLLSLEEKRGENLSNIPTCPIGRGCTQRKRKMNTLHFLSSQYDGCRFVRNVESSGIGKKWHVLN